MLDIIANAVAGAIQTILVSFITPFLGLVQQFLNLFSNVGSLMDITYMPFINVLITYGQAIAVSLLVLRLAWEAFQIVSLKADGAPTDPGGLLKRTVFSVVAIFAGPFLVRQMIVVGNNLALMVANSGFGFNPANIDFATALENAMSLAGLGFTAVLTVGFFPLIVVIVVLVFMILIALQALARTVEITLSAVLAPFLSLGIMSGGGTFDVWWRETLVIAMSHPIQMLLLYLSVAFLVAPGFGSTLAGVRPFFFIASLWVTFKTPQIVRNYAYSTGTRSAIGTAGQAAMWSFFSKLGH